MRCKQLRRTPTGPGVYVFYHDRMRSNHDIDEAFDNPAKESTVVKSKNDTEFKRSKTYIELIKEAALYLEKHEVFLRGWT